MLRVVRSLDARDDPEDASEQGDRSASPTSHARVCSRRHPEHPKATSPLTR
jgi:hypothetical protein